MQTSAKPYSILRRKQVESLTGLSSSTIYDKLDPRSPRHDPDFPRQFRLGGNSVGWLEQDIYEWVRKRVLETTSAR